jgi:hypothetical protein
MPKPEILLLLSKDHNSSQFPVFDPAALDMLKDLKDENDRDLRFSLIETYLLTTASDLSEMKKVLSSDAIEFHRLAHTLKSTSAALGGILLSKIFASLEVGHHSEQEKRTLMASAEEEFYVFTESLKSYQRSI